VHTSFEGQFSALINLESSLRALNLGQPKDLENDLSRPSEHESLLATLENGLKLSQASVLLSDTFTRLSLGSHNGRFSSATSRSPR
jgi:hypothetical protein